jgi:hypothetical protein
MAARLLPPLGPSGRWGSGEGGLRPLTDFPCLVLGYGGFDMQHEPVHWRTSNQKAAIAPFDLIEWTSTKLRMGSNYEREYWL